MDIAGFAVKLWWVVGGRRRRSGLLQLGSLVLGSLVLGTWESLLLESLLLASLLLGVIDAVPNGSGGGRKLVHVRKGVVVVTVVQGGCVVCGGVLGVLLVLLRELCTSSAKLLRLSPRKAWRATGASLLLTVRLVSTVDLVAHGLTKLRPGALLVAGGNLPVDTLQRNFHHPQGGLKGIHLVTHAVDVLYDTQGGLVARVVWLCHVELGLDLVACGHKLGQLFAVLYEGRVDGGGLTIVGAVGLPRVGHLDSV